MDRVMRESGENYSAAFGENYPAVDTVLRPWGRSANLVMSSGNVGYRLLEKLSVVSGQKGMSPVGKIE